MYSVRHTWLVLKCKKSLTLAHIYKELIKDALQNTLVRVQHSSCLAAFKIVQLICMFMHREHFCWDWQWIVSVFAYTGTDCGGKPLKQQLCQPVKRGGYSKERCFACANRICETLLLIALSVMSAESYIIMARADLRRFITLEIRKRGFQIRR